VNAVWLTEDGRPEGPISAAELEAEGVSYQALSTDSASYQGPLDALKAAQGYVEQDEVALGPDTENLDEICAKFVDEHSHTEDEVRFVLAGAGVFDIRSTTERWMQVTVEAGDLIVVPANRYHRFRLTEARAIRCVRLFQDRAGWVPQYRIRAG